MTALLRYLRDWLFPARKIAMTRAEHKRLETIIGKIERLQNQTPDLGAKDRLGKAKAELLRLRGDVLP